MSASGPVLLLVGPIVGALLTLLLSRWRRTAAVVGILETWLLWGMLISIPLAPTEVERANRLFAGDTLLVFGRPFVLSEGIRALFLFILAALSLLFLLSILQPQGRHFIPAALAALSPLAGSLMVEPLAFGALLLLLGLAVLVAAIQAERVTSTGPALRFLLMAVLAIPLIMVAGWMLSGEQLALVQPGSLLLLISAAILLAGFPFHIWVSPIIVEASTMTMVLIFGLVQIVVTAFVFGILRTNPALQRQSLFAGTLRLSGVATALLAGLLVLTANDLRRWLSGFLLLDMGMTLLTLTIDSIPGWRLATLMQTARVVSLLLLTMGMVLSQGERNVEFAAFRGAARRDPLAAALLVYGCASLLGLPLTVGFAGRWNLLLATQQAPDSPWLPYLLWLAMIGGTAGLVRGIAPMLSAAGDEARPLESPSPWLRVAALLLLIVGGWFAVFPQALSDYVGRLIGLFP